MFGWTGAQASLFGLADGACPRIAKSEGGKPVVSRPCPAEVSLDG
ncbi:hypothetical protein [Prauserella flavalba]|nr:hypothetical protein [Prauserella flavalba]